MTSVLMRNDERKVAIQRFGYTEPCIANGENAVIAFWVGAQKVRKSGQEALRHTGSITITRCWASSVGRYRHETTVEYSGPWRQIS